jgi:hypothetical protein
MAHALKVGSDIDAQCTKCKMVLGHTILAMVGNKPARVRCNTCGGEHNYRGTQSNPPKKGTWQPKAVERAKPVVTTRELFAADDLLEHPTFGLGLVQMVRGDKIEVAFKADVKTLVHGKA